MGTILTGETEPPKDEGANDRRTSLRRSVVDSQLITVDLAFQTGALLLDLSETGMGVQALGSVPSGTTTPLHFDLPETGGRIVGVGRIAWTDSSGRLGIRFEEIAERSRLHLAQWLARDRRPLIAPGPNVALPSWPPAHTRDEIAALRRELTSDKLTGDAALTYIVERVRSMTRATGGAIALEEGGEIVCRASSGNAPGIGARVDPNLGLSGECVRTGEIVRCEDTETDPRADRLVCRRLELRSIVIVPVRVQGCPAGVLEVFSSRAHAFESSDVLLLRRVSELVAGITVSQPGPAPSSVSRPHTVMAAALMEPFLADPQAEETMPAMIEEILKLDVEERPAPPPAPKPQPAVEPTPVVVSTASVAPVERPVPPPAPKPQPAVEPTPVVVSTASVAPIERPVPPPPVPAPVVKSEVKAEQEPPAKRSLVAVEKTVAPPPVERVAPREASVPAVVSVPVVASTPVAPLEAVAPPPPVNKPDFVKPRAMAAAAAAAVQASARPKPAPVRDQDEDGGDELPTAASTREAVLSSLAAQRPSPWRLRTTGGVILVAVLVIGGWQVWRAFAPPQGTPMDSEFKRANPAAAPPSNTAAPTIAASTTAAPVPANAVPPAAKPSASQPGVAVAKPVPVGVVTAPAIPPGPAKDTPEEKVAETITLPPPNVTNVTKAIKAEADPPPAIAMATHAPSELSAISHVLHAPVPVPTLEARVSHISGGKLIKRFDPVYPSGAMGMHGEVILKATINREGKVTAVQVVRGQAVLAQAAAAAVKRWRYQPFVLNGTPLEVENTITVNFKAPGQR